MRPTPDEVVAGVVRILRDTVAPAVQDDHARVQLAQVIAVLHGLDAGNAARDVAARDTELVALLAECAAWVGDEPGRAAFFGRGGDVGGIARTRPVAGVAVDAAGFAELNERHESNRAMLAAFIERLRAWRAANGTGDSAVLLGRIGAHLSGSGG